MSAYTFTVLDVTAEPYAASPQLTCRLRIEETTGRRVHAPFVTMFDIADGRITSHRPYWDMAGFMAQLTS